MRMGNAGEQPMYLNRNRIHVSQPRVDCETVFRPVHICLTFTGSKITRKLSEFGSMQSDIREDWKMMDDRGWLATEHTCGSRLLIAECCRN